MKTRVWQVHVDFKMKRIFAYHVTNTFMPTLSLLVAILLISISDETFSDKF
jgi:hypothetical protein